MAKENDEVVFVPEPEPAKQKTEGELIDADVKKLEAIQTDLEDLKSVTGSTTAWFYRGMMQGAGAIIGSLAMLILLGWVLSFLGFIPGFRDIADYISGYADKVTR